MINITDKKKCCGCEACVQICPKQCIYFNEDHEGFRYPSINTDDCINCGLCEKICPVTHQDEARKPMSIYAAKNCDEVTRAKSSSGGLFTSFAEQVIKDEGVVFGAKFDKNWDVIHDYTETIEGIEKFCGSKYVQSRIGSNFQKVKDFLVLGRRVLFCGTPCQVAGLRNFLQKEYYNLLTVDFICHGTPSPLVWRNYKQEILNSVKNSSSFSNIEFRNKRDGWRKFSFVASVKTEEGSLTEYAHSFSQNEYMIGFLKNIYLRPSCHHCAFKSLRSGSDITIADFWGIHNYHPKIDDNKGVSLVINNSSIGASMFQNIDVESVVSTENALQKVLFESVKPHINRTEFFIQILNGESVCSLVTRLTYEPFTKRVFKRVVSKFNSAIRLLKHII